MQEVQLHFTEETPLGYSQDRDFTITIPATGRVGPELPEQYGLANCAKSSFIEKFTRGRSRAPEREPRLFDAIKTDGDLYLMWIPERREWIGLYYQLTVGPYEQNIYGGGCEEHIDVAGPFRLNERCGRCIAQVYDHQTENFEEVLRLSPVELDKTNLNRFQVSFVPENVQIFELRAALHGRPEFEAMNAWAFCRVNLNSRRVLAFSGPPSDLGRKLGIERVGASPWRSVPEIEGMRRDRVVPALICRSLEIACISKGLVRCERGHSIYIPEHLFDSGRLHFSRDDGTRSFVEVAGRRQGSAASSYFRYAVVPVFRVEFARDGLFGRVYDSPEIAVFLEVGLHLTGDDGDLLAGRTMLTERKHLFELWCKEGWFHRSDAIMEWLGIDGAVKVGSADERVEVSSRSERCRLMANPTATS